MLCCGPRELVSINPPHVALIHACEVWTAGS
jgi:hypothetical protein